MRAALKKYQYIIPWIGYTVLAAGIVVGVVTYPRWFPFTQKWVSQTVEAYRTQGNISHQGHDHEPNEHAGHDHSGHDHAGHDDATSIELSPQAMRNVGLTADQVRPIQLETYHKSITVPAVIVERPGRTQVKVATPMTGVITHVHALQGEAVRPGALLFKIRLTHEDLVQAQTEFLRTLGELDVEKREITRLTQVTSSGAVAGKVLLEREYARDKLQAQLNAQREALRLHGLSDEQVEEIADRRRLLRELHIFAPGADEHPEEELNLTRILEPSAEQNDLSRINESTRPVVYVQEGDEHPATDTPLILQELFIHKGQSVVSGETLCVLANLDELLIEGLAFEQDITHLRETSLNSWGIDALFDKGNGRSVTVPDLQIAYLANQVDAESRTLHFYVKLTNEIVKDDVLMGNRYVQWKYLPGQRLQLRVPVEMYENQIVLPVDAVANEGAESYVFQQNGHHFDRVPVHIKYRDQSSVVIANDGNLFPGDVVAMRGAHQLMIALKNKSGGGVDPHAGHNH